MCVCTLKLFLKRKFKSSMHCARHFGIHLVHSLMIHSKISICNRMERLLTILKCKQLGIALKTNINIHGQAL
jgi:hypothetical protein